VAFVAAPYVMLAGSTRAASKRNDRLNAAVIGCGGRGTSMAWAQLGQERANVVAICDADLRKARRAAETIKAKVGQTPRIYQDYRDVLARKDIEVVGNATPDHWHTRINIDACRAGKDIYTEKPMTLTVDEGRLLRKVVRETGRIVQVGSQQRSSFRFRAACELVRNGRIGKLKAVGVLLPFIADCKSGHAVKPVPVPEGLDWGLWQGQAPERPFSDARLAFRRWHEYAGGVITDWGHHHFDIAHWGMGMDQSGPQSVDARGYMPFVHRTDCFNNVDILSAHLKYPGDLDLWCITVRDAGYLEHLAAGYPTAEADKAIYANVPDEIKSVTRNGVLFIGDRGRIFVHRQGSEGIDFRELKKNPLPAGSERLYVSNDHMGDLIDCIKTRKAPICPVEVGQRSVTPCHLVNISMRLRRKIVWDAAKEQVVGDDQARAMLSRPQRPPYEIS
jgi:predicted dehydrogenase